MLIAINPFLPNVPFLYPMKTSENLSNVSKGFLTSPEGMQMNIGLKWVKRKWQQRRSRDPCNHPRWGALQQ